MVRTEPLTPLVPVYVSVSTPPGGVGQGMTSLSLSEKSYDGIGAGPTNETAFNNGRSHLHYSSRDLTDVTCSIFTLHTRSSPIQGIAALPRTNGRIALLPPGFPYETQCRSDNSACRIDFHRRTSCSWSHSSEGNACACCEDQTRIERERICGISDRGGKTIAIYSSVERSSERPVLYWKVLTTSAPPKQGCRSGDYGEQIAT